MFEKWEDEERMDNADDRSRVNGFGENKLDISGMGKAGIKTNQPQRKYHKNVDYCIFSGLILMEWKAVILERSWVESKRRKKKKRLNHFQKLIVWSFCEKSRLFRNDGKWIYFCPYSFILCKYFFRIIWGEKLDHSNTFVSPFSKFVAFILEAGVLFFDFFVLPLVCDIFESWSSISKKSWSEIEYEGECCWLSPSSILLKISAWIALDFGTDFFRIKFNEHKTLVTSYTLRI